MDFSKENMEIGSNAMALMGIGHLTYIRSTHEGFGVFAADGTQLAVFPNYDAAYFTARQYNLIPVSVH